MLAQLKYLAVRPTEFSQIKRAKIFPAVVLNCFFFFNIRVIIANTFLRFQRLSLIRFLYYKAILGELTHISHINTTIYLNLVPYTSNRLALYRTSSLFG